MNNVSELLTKTETLKGESQTIFFLKLFISCAGGSMGNGYKKCHVNIC